MTYNKSMDIIPRCIDIKLLSFTTKAFFLKPTLTEIEITLKNCAQKPFPRIDEVSGKILSVSTHILTEPLEYLINQSF